MSHCETGYTPPSKIVYKTRNGNRWNKICGGIVGFTKIHTCVTEGCNVKKHAIKEPELLPDRIYICTPQAGGKGNFTCILLWKFMKLTKTS